MASPVKVLLVEWMGYPLFRTKPLGRARIKCGLGALVQNMKRFDPGVEFDCTVIVNEMPAQWHAVLDGVPGVRRLLLNQARTNSREKYERFLSDFPFISEVVFRENHLQDIGAYDHFYRAQRQAGYGGHVLLANSSVRGPVEDGWLAKYQQLFEREADTGMCGISLNSHNTMLESRPFSPHLQSFFLYTSMPVLQRVFPDGLFGGPVGGEAASKTALVEHGEIGLSQKVLAAGLGLRCSMFPDFFYKSGDDWAIPEGDLRFTPEYADQANLC